MKRILLTLAVLVATPFITGGSCASTGGAEPEIRTIEVAVPVVKPCPDKRDRAPVYPDTDEALAAAVAAKDLPAAFKLLLAARPLHYRRHAEDDGQIAACAMPPP